MRAPTDAGDLLCEDAVERPVWRVGYAPEPWAWTPWQYADSGLFPARWDDPNGVWRSIYAGETPLACYLEVLAAFRPDPHLAVELGDIDEDPTDAAEHPTSAGGVLSRQWCEPRRIGAANLSGWYVVPADVESLPTLRSRFLSLAVRYRVPDVDAAAIRQAEPRSFTQAIAAWLYEQSDPRGDPVAGVRFESRHGDGLRLWAVFERPDDGDVSSRFASAYHGAIDTDEADLVEAMRIHRLQWAG